MPIIASHSIHQEGVQELWWAGDSASSDLCPYSKDKSIHSVNQAVFLSAQESTGDEDHPEPEPQEGPWRETAPTCQPWFVDTYPNSEFLPQTEFNSFWETIFISFYLK